MVKISFFTSFFKNIAFPVGAFLLAVLLWLFVVSGDQYTMMLDLPIEARNLNSQKTYLEEVPGYASVILKGKGRGNNHSTLETHLMNMNIPGWNWILMLTQQL